MTYWPGQPPANAAQLGAYVRAELEKIAAEMRELPTLQLKVLHVEPAKPRDGMLATADGSDWNPGSGAGLYRHDGSAWVFIG